MPPYILVVEDEPDIRELLDFAISRSGFSVIEAETAEDALKVLDRGTPELIIIDWMLPGMSGVEFAKRVRGNPNTKNIPIIMLTAKSDESNKLKGLDTGADDYMTKPFSPKELIARIKAVLRRKSPELVDEPISIKGLALDPNKHLLQYNNKTITIGPTEFKLLNFFMKNPDRVFSRNQILDKIWGNKSDIDDRTVDVHIKRLRDTLKISGQESLIKTIRGIGYRLSKD